MHKRMLLISAICIATWAFMGSIATAEEPNAAASAQTDPTIDRDGQHICGFDLMNDSERAGYRNLMHKTPDRADRDEIRVAHCEAMKKRASEKRVKDSQ